MQFESALASTFLRGETDLQVKVASAFASTFLRGEETFWAVSLGCDEPSQELMGELKSVLGHTKVLHSILLLVRCAKVIWLIREKFTDMEDCL